MHMIIFSHILCTVFYPLIANVGAVEKANFSTDSGKNILTLPLLLLLTFCWYFIYHMPYMIALIFFVANLNGI